MKWRSLLLLACACACAKTPPPGASDVGVATPVDAALPPPTASTAPAVGDARSRLAEECARHPETDACRWRKADQENGGADTVAGTDARRARDAMERHRAEVFACVAKPMAGSALGEELRRRVRVRVAFSTGGTPDQLLFETKAAGYGFIDKFHHVCIADALGGVRLTPADAGGEMIVVYTYLFDDAGAGR